MTWEEHVCAVHKVDKLLTKLDGTMDSRLAGRKN